jgi:hypothetical protein
VNWACSESGTLMPSVFTLPFRASVIAENLLDVV